MFNLGFHGSHNATLAISFEKEVLEVIEVERFVSHKNASLFFYAPLPNPIKILKEIQGYLERKYDVSCYENIIYNSVDTDVLDFDEVFQYRNLIPMPHHEAHCYSALYQSPYPAALVISFDGGSDEGFFNVFLGSRGYPAKKIYEGGMDYAISYMAPAHFIRDIRRESSIGIGNLVYPGKLMGLVGYGEYREDLAERLISFYQSNTYDNIIEAMNRFVECFSDYGIESWDSYFGERDGRDVAMTNQIVFERLFREEVLRDDFMQGLFRDLPLVITGGCGLNILHNTEVAREREVFIPPNPSDAGLALGMLCGIIKPEATVDATYLGPPAWDRNELGRYLVERHFQPLNLDDLADIILGEGIVGVVRGGSEHGPRALGNRSLICDATNPEMKDLMNHRIKNREWFRPLSPVVRLEDLEKYFEWSAESRWMTFSPRVKPAYSELLKSVVHVDGTARVQTVTREQNQFTYDLLKALHEKNGHGILLNTSFNIAGKPILNTYRDAFQMLDEKEISGLILEDYFFPKVTAQ
jgi:carbamoyltransferase